MAMMTSTIDYTKARTQFPKMPELLKENKVLWVHKHGKAMFAMVDSEIMQMYLETMEILRDPVALAVLQQSLEDIKRGKLHDHESAKRELLDDDS
jgi:PHD/YefM family antitoxin component YafN of YafNO toxin-antitoxin module